MLSRIGYIRIENSALMKIGKLVGVFLLAELLFTLAEIAIGLYSLVSEEYEVIHWLIAGSGTPFFYIELVAIAVGLIPLTKDKRNLVLTGSAIAFFAVSMIKYNMI